MSGPPPSGNPGQNEWRFAGDDVTPAEPSVHRPLSSGDLASVWEMDEFFEALGPVMRLPPKEDEPPAPIAARGGRQPRFLVMLAVAMMLGAAAWGLFQALVSRSERLPAELVGKWRTTSRAYAGRMFEITGDTLRLQLGADSVVSHPIVGVHSKKQDGVTWYAITYGAGADLSDIALGLDPDSTIHIVHQPAVSWRKAGR